MKCHLTSYETPRGRCHVYALSCTGSTVWVKGFSGHWFRLNKIGFSLTAVGCHTFCITESIRSDYQCGSTFLKGVKYQYYMLKKGVIYKDSQLFI